MSSPDNPRLERIQRVSGRIATACGVLLIAFPLLMIGMSLVWPEFLAIQSAARQLGVQADEISWLARIASSGAWLVSFGPLLWGLWIMRRLFQSYARGAVFSKEAADQLKRVAYAVFALILARPIGGALFSLSLSIDVVKHGGQGQLMLSVGSTEVWLALAGSMVLVIAWIMGEAAALADENKSFV